MIGRGPEEERLRQDLPANVAILGGVTDEELRWAYAHCVALVAPSLEDYGLTPLEAGAFGKPTLALRGGGYLDTVAEGVNGPLLRPPRGRGHRPGVAANRAAAGTPRRSCDTAGGSTRRPSATRSPRPWSAR